MKKIEIYYWKETKYISQDFQEDRPTSDNFIRDYAHIISFPAYCIFTNEQILCDQIFRDFNLDHHPFVKYPLPNGCHHTSMSVGDVIRIDETYYIVMRIGFEILKF